MAGFRAGLKHAASHPPAQVRHDLARPRQELQAVLGLVVVAAVAVANGWQLSRQPLGLKVVLQVRYAF